MRLCIGTTKRNDDAWLTRWLKSPEQMMQNDAEIKQPLAHFKWADQNVKKP